MHFNLDNIPGEMRMRPQWACATLYVNGDAKPSKMPINPVTGKAADTTNPKTWATFDQCAQAVAEGRYKAFGYILSPDDDYTVIDLDKLDRPNRTRDPATDPQEWLLQNIPGYKEWSISGTGVHLITRAKIGGGFRRGGVEIYDRDRFMILTGWAYPQHSYTAADGRTYWTPTGLIEAAPDELHDMVSQLRPASEPLPGVGSWSAGGKAWKGDTAALIARIKQAANGEKFTQLFENIPGDGWSEADAALVGIVANYTRDYSQIRDVWEASRLWRAPGTEGASIKPKRKTQAQYDVYVNRTIEMQLRRRWAEDQVKEAHAAALSKAVAAMHKTSVKVTDQDTFFKIKRPRGLLGDLTDYIYSASPHPMLEVALAGAITVMAGLAGRPYITASGLGLNQYIMVMAGTAAGKNAIFGAVRDLVFSLEGFGHDNVWSEYNAGNFSHGNALRKRLSQHASGFSMFDEFVGKLKEMDVGRSPNAESLKYAMLQAYTASGRNGFMDRTEYAKDDNNVKAVKRPAWSFMGNGTIEGFFDCLNGNNFSEGLIPRLITFIVDRPKPHFNRNMVREPSPVLRERFASFLMTCMAWEANANQTDNPYSPRVVEYADAGVAESALALNDYYTDLGNARRKTPQGDVWSRAWEKVMKLAALVAVGVDPQSPTMTHEDIAWARSIVERDIMTLLANMEAGEIQAGSDEMNVITEAVKRYWAVPDETLRNTYAVSPDIRSLGLIPRTYLARVLRQKRPFKSMEQDKRSRAINGAIFDAVKEGVLTAVDHRSNPVAGIHSDNAVYRMGAALSGKGVGSAELGA